MKLLFTLILSLCIIYTHGQTPLTEGVIRYDVSLTTDSSGSATYTGYYIITVKGKELRKELKLNNGYDDVIIINYTKRTAYSLKKIYDKKYAIQLNMDDFLKHQETYNVKELKPINDTAKIAGMSAINGAVYYIKRPPVKITYTADWFLNEGRVFEQFPDIKVLPLIFTIYTRKGYKMHFVINKLAQTPIDNSDFIIPLDYKIISNKEFELMDK